MSDVAIGLDVGGTKALALLVGRDGEVRGEMRRQTPHDGTGGAGEATAHVLVALARDLAEQNGLKAHEVPIGIGLPGMLRRDGVLVLAPNLPTANGSNVASLVASELGNDRVYSENDANCAALSEHEWGAARGIADFVMVTLGTGIGGGIFVDQQLVRGRSGFAGEIGHMVVEANGEPCGCGSRGCWERYASGSGLQRLTKVAAAEGRLPTLVARRGGDVDAVDGEDVTAACAEGLDEALAVASEVGWWLAQGLANLTAILDCGHFVIGGGLSDASGFILPAARGALAELVEGFAERPTITIVNSTFGPRAGGLGAALVAFDGA